MRDTILNIIDKYVGKSSYKKNVIVMVVGRVIAQAIPILLSPLLTRIYSPSQFGVFGVYMAIVSFVSMISNGRYTHAIVLPKEKEKSQNIVLISSLFTLLFTLSFSIVFLFTKEQFFTILNIKSINQYFFLLILNILILGLYEPLFVYELREKRYKKLAINVVIQSVVLIIVRVVVGYFGFTDLGLILSYLIGYTISYLLLLYRTDIKIDILSFRKDFKNLITKYVNFPKFTLLSDSLIVLTNSFPSILLNRLFGSDSAGYFALSEKILGSPIWFVTSSVGDVFRQEASEKYRNGESCKDIYIKTTKTMFKIGIIPFLLIFFAIPPLIPFVFGEVWEPVGDYIKIFSTMYFSSFIVNPVSHIVNIVNKQKYAVLFQGMKFFSILIAFVIGYFYKNLILGLLVWSGLVTISNALICFMSYKFSKILKT